MPLKKLLLFVCLFAVIIRPVIIYPQTGEPVRTQWRSPDGSQPMSFSEWEKNWDSQAHKTGGVVKYRSWNTNPVVADSFVFGDDYAYFKGFVRHSDGTLCEESPPIASFTVTLNGDDSIILMDNSPRWAIGDPNISGLGWYGIELGNFIDPEVTLGDSFQITFSCYNTSGEYEQGEYQEYVYSLPLVSFPGILYLENRQIPLPPTDIKLRRENGQIRISWNRESGLDYTIYRRAQSDTLVLNYPRRQYEKIAENIIDSVFFDNSIDTTEAYAYLLFSARTQNGLKSGRSREVREEDLFPRVRAVFVQPELYNAIETRLMQMVQDWQDEDAEVIVYAMQFSSVQAFRDTLRSIPGLTGALLIGDFPVPWFQFCDDNGENYQEYPADLYYMDLDGVWEDNFQHPVAGPLIPGSDGIFDTHYADYPRTSEKPDIVIGRITPTPSMGDPAEVVNNYLNKCYRYRHDIGDIRQNFRALAYPDDDWNTWGHDIARDYLSLVYPEYDCIFEINATTGTGYRERLDEHYSLIHVWVHSWTQGHAFSVNNGTQTEYFYNSQILPSNTNANFFHLFACGNCRYVEDLNCGAVYALQTTAGINTIGSTHSGGMLDFNYFYQRLAEGISFGEAYFKTFEHVGQFGFSSGTRSWYYGLTFNGDPFIIPQPSTITKIVQENKIPETQVLSLSNYPNPFNSTTTIECVLPENSKISLTIYNLLGQPVKNLTSGTYPAGTHKFYWDGVDNLNRKVASGVYLSELKINGNRTATRKILLLQ
jgi:hypothetical protein